MAFTGIVGNGKVKNVYAYNCYASGVLARSSIMTFENLKFGPCGATGIELAPEKSDEAGLNFNEKQVITISGTINATANVNAGNTIYFQHYNIGGVAVPQVINGLAGNIVEIVKTSGSAYGEQLATMLGWHTVSHLQNSNNEFIFVSLIFNGATTNQSSVYYPNYQEGGIITTEQLIYDVLTKTQVNTSTGEVKPYTNTTHQFIELPIEFAGFKVGKALLTTRTTVNNVFAQLQIKASAHVK